MSASPRDQAAGLRQWASLQRRHQADDSAQEAPLPATPAAPAAEAPVVNARPARRRTVLMVVGLPGRGPRYVERVKARLGQWAALGRRWAGAPDDWDVRLVMPDDPALPRLTREHARWALWVESNADAFTDTYRTLRQLAQNGGPRRLLALHEPHLPRAGLLDNLHDAARCYVGVKLLILAQ
ncbi:hypothetical protein GCM10022228_14240 [Halomonas cibimaris]|uniref:Uncharacterized protein n=1 Tax=Halomonas cibimaris TaxID=657012 RepID=A0ABP7LSG4_9GAMM